jgi:hypothetical protein
MSFLREMGVIFGIVIGFSFFAIVIDFVFNHFRNLSRLNKHCGYDRPLTSKERAYIESAQAALIDAGEQVKTYPKWYGWFLAFGYLPVMFAMMAVFVGSMVLLTMVLSKLIIIADGAEITSDNFGASILLGVFGGVIFAGAIMYMLTLRSDRLSQYIALNSDIWGFDTEAIHHRQIAHVVNSVRAHEIDIDYPFDVAAFLRWRNISYRNGCFKWTAVIMLPAIIFSIFDARNQQVLYEDHLLLRGSYFSVFPMKNILVTEIDRVDVRCFREDGNNDLDYIIWKDGKELISFDVNEENLTPLYKLDQKIRSQDVEFRPHARRKKGQITRSFYHAKCVDTSLQEYATRGTEIKSVLHVGDGL